MVFKRRDQRSILAIFARFLYPQGGWARAFRYIRHRVRRLPDSPERISRGIWAGVFVTFTPLYGLHFITAAIIARVLNGNIIAALMATFFGNPLTYVPIGFVSLKLGHWIMRTEFIEGSQSSVVDNFINAWRDLKHNFFAIFTENIADWTILLAFFQEIFLPYLVGGILPGIIAASVLYFLSVSIIRAYQSRRKGKLKAKLAAIKKKASPKKSAKSS
ncbi:MAG: DUF2062 domain-containing protein [Aestuariivita sp.]|nr:DUF2062 domain-containing protein [Aestuariivita sp.]